MKQKLLIVDDDKAILDLVRDFLGNYDYQVDTAASAAEMEQALGRKVYDLVLLDLKLPDGDGLSLAARLRASSGLPIIMLSSLGSEVDRIVGLELGADDYLVKPFNPRELLARIRAVLRRSQQTPISAARPLTVAGHIVYRFDDWLLDTTARQLFAPDGEPVTLTGGEFDILEAFVRAPNRVLTREQLLAATHTADTEVFDRSVDVLILRLRRKIEANPRQPKYIKTERGIGYIFSASVATVE